jgi:prepilin-type N-terminal cleavage/methylation domain-containing protein
MIKNDNKSIIKEERAFTLVELLCVLALLGLLTMIAMPAVRDVSRKRPLEIAARSLTTDMRRCQQTAIVSGGGRCLEFLLYSNIYHYRIKNCNTSETERISFPEGITYRSTTFPTSGGIPRLRFNPDGAPNAGGTVVLQNSRGDILYVIVTPATGRVRVSDKPPDYWDSY